MTQIIIKKYLKNSLDKLMTLKYFSTMKMTLIKYFVIFLSIMPLLKVQAGASIPENGFTAHSFNGDILIHWQTTSETNVKYFIVERRTQYSDFMEVATINPESDRYYEYTDKNVFKSNDNIYYYRIKIVDKDGNVSYTNEISVLHSTATSVKRTWGSIKALFR
ncbi:MAG: hypothetical protein CO129_04240 [Ignavibacteriales bacterium CG_4_9_14_3_um_filter_34_10]|nr:MAG: hypothetical protein CO129_04240 [Ignavibacteriales bacterium CG_4_9_14_3_um_filter_34_10]